MLFSQSSCLLMHQLQAMILCMLITNCTPLTGDSCGVEVDLWMSKPETAIRHQHIYLGVSQPHVQAYPCQTKCFCSHRYVWETGEVQCTHNYQYQHRCQIKFMLLVMNHLQVNYGLIGSCQCITRGPEIATHRNSQTYCSVILQFLFDDAIKCFASPKG